MPRESLQMFMIDPRLTKVNPSGDSATKLNCGHLLVLFDLCQSLRACPKERCRRIYDSASIEYLDMCHCSGRAVSAPGAKSARMVGAGVSEPSHLMTKLLKVRVAPPVSTTIKHILPTLDAISPAKMNSNKKNNTCQRQ